MHKATSASLDTATKTHHTESQQLLFKQSQQNRKKTKNIVEHLWIMFKDKRNIVIYNKY